MLHHNKNKSACSKFNLRSQIGIRGVKYGFCFEVQDCTYIIDLYSFFQGLAFVTMMILRCADITGSGWSVDDGHFIRFVVFSFFYIVLVQLIGILLGDRSPIQVYTRWFVMIWKLNFLPDLGT